MRTRRARLDEIEAKLDRLAEIEKRLAALERVQASQWYELSRLSGAPVEQEIDE